MNKEKLHQLSWQDIEQINQQLEEIKKQRQVAFYDTLKTKDVQQLNDFAAQHPGDFSFIPFVDFHIDFYLGDLPFVQLALKYLKNHPDLKKFKYHFLSSYYCPDSLDPYWAPVEADFSSYGLFYKGLQDNASFIVLAEAFSHEFLSFIKEELLRNKLEPNIELIDIVKKYYSSDDCRDIFKAFITNENNIETFDYFRQIEAYQSFFDDKVKINYILKSSIYSHHTSFFDINKIAHDDFFKNLFFNHSEHLSNFCQHAMIYHNSVWLKFLLTKYESVHPKHLQHQSQTNFIIKTSPECFAIVLPYVNHDVKTVNLFVKSFEEWIYKEKTSFLEEQFIIYFDYIKTNNELLEEFKRCITYLNKNSLFYKLCNSILLENKLDKELYMSNDLISKNKL